MKWAALPLLAALLLTGCADPEKAAEPVAQTVDSVVETAQEVAQQADSAASDTQISLSSVATPAVLAVQEAIEAVVEPLPPPVARPHSLPRDVVAHIERWEVGSPGRYNKSLSGLYCPPGASGPTGGIGYDFGHQTAAEIRSTWANHPRVDDLATASGKTGPAACKAWVAKHKTIRIFYSDATDVFERNSLPKYERMAARALRKGWDDMPLRPRGIATAMGYNRGWSMSGSKNTEKRVIRDDCYPGADFMCQADQLVAMCRIWEGTAYYTGLCNRRKDEARLSRQG